MISVDVQKLAAGSAVDLFEIDSTNIGGAVLRWVNESNSISFGKAIPIRAFLLRLADLLRAAEVHSHGQLSRLQTLPVFSAL